MWFGVFFFTFTKFWTNRVNINYWIDEIYFVFSFHWLFFLFSLSILSTCLSYMYGVKKIHVFFIFAFGPFQTNQWNFIWDCRDTGSSGIHLIFSCRNPELKKTVMPSFPRSSICVDITIVVFLFFFNGESVQNHKAWWDFRIHENQNKTKSWSDPWIQAHPGRLMSSCVVTHKSDHLNISECEK